MSAPGFALFSGGHDSLCATHVAMTNGYAQEVVHVNTGIGVEATREFVRETCAAHGWPLNELSPPRSYDDLVIEHGFPGPAGYPEVDARIAVLEARVTAAGRHGDVWGFRPPNVHPAQMRMDGAVLCSSCLHVSKEHPE